MFRKLILVLIITVLATSVLALKVHAYEDGDFQIWNTDTEEYKVNKDLKVAFEQEFRWGNNASEFYYQHYDLGLIYALSKHWSVGGGYRQVYELSKNKFLIENEPYLTATLSLSGGGFNFESRNRLEYRYFEHKADSGRYRNKFTLKYPLKIAKVEIQPYVSDEVLFGFGGTNQFNQNRLSSGLGINLTQNIKAEVYYMLVTVKISGKWMDSNVLGTKLKIAF